MSDHTLREDRPSREQIARLREIENTKTGKGAKRGKGESFGKSDRIIAGKALHRIVQEAQQVFGVSINDIKGEVEIRSTKVREKQPGTNRIDRYTLKESLSAEEASVRAESLSQRVNGYLDFASAVANLTNRDPDELKMRILGETKVWRGIKRNVSANEGHDLDGVKAANLSNLLRSLSETVIRDSKLPQILSLARKVPGVWDVSLEQFRSYPSSIMASNIPVKRNAVACLYQPAYLGQCEHWTESPPLPSVPLVRYRYSDFITDIVIDPTAAPTPQPFYAVDTTPIEGESRVASFTLYRELRLALGPTTTSATCGPMFENRAYVELNLAFEENGNFQTRRLYPNVSLKPVDDLFRCYEGQEGKWKLSLEPQFFQICIDDGWHRVIPTEPLGEAQCHTYPGNNPICWAPDPLDSKSPAIEHWYLAWIELNEGTVRCLLDQPVANNIIPCLAPGGEEPPSMWYMNGSVAWYVERSLYDGTLEYELRSAVDRLRRALDHRQADWIAAATQRTGAALASWKGSRGEHE